MIVTNKTAGITGGACGLGREIARTLFNTGYRVAINYLHSHGPAEELGVQFGDRALLFKADVGSSAEIAEMAARVQVYWGPLMYWSTMSVRL